MQTESKLSASAAFPAAAARRTTAGLVVVGGGPAGHAALQAYREAGGPGPVVMISEDTRPPYNRPPLSKDFLRGESDEDSLPLEDDSFYRADDNELLLADSVVALDPAARSVTTSSGRQITYRRCILATGCSPVLPGFPGHEGVLPLRRLDDARQLRESAQVASNAVVIGSGFIGCEAAASLAARGLAVSMVSSEHRPQLNRLGTDAADLITGWLTDAGVRLYGDTQVTDVASDPAVTGGPARRTVRLSDGTKLAADLVLSAIGAVPRVELAEQAGLAVENGRIRVDQRMRTAVDGLFAAGDAVSAFNSAAGRHLSVEHWGEAERMGTIAGRVAAGGDDQWSEAPGFWSEIGEHTVKYAAWGDGYDTATPVRHVDGGLTVWYARDGVTVGVLTSGADEDYELGAELVRTGSPAQAGLTPSSAPG